MTASIFREGSARRKRSNRRFSSVALAALLLPATAALSFSGAARSEGDIARAVAESRAAPVAEPVILLPNGDAAAILHENAALYAEEVAASATPDVTEDLGSGLASYYGNELAGNRTASGEPFDPAQLTAAHRTLPMGSRVRVTNPRTGETVIVRINDRGPFHGNRVIDLSAAAARQVGIFRAGSGTVGLALLAN